MSLSEVVLSKLVGCNTALEAWTRLATAYGYENRHSICQLKDQFEAPKCGSDSIEKYLERAKDVADRLASINLAVSDDDLVARYLKGFGEKFLPFVRAIEAKSDPIYFDDFHVLLLREKQRLEQSNLLHDGPSAAHFSRGGCRRFSGRSVGRGRR
ncbi:unnamed protein product [Linum trigynum]|uniref:Retrotransposon gag domain-containing protein n=1 Tax=Linum trigynum TaxID=586398 RepID=A0AAV2CCF6_9ROSI